MAGKERARSPERVLLRQGAGGPGQGTGHGAAGSHPSLDLLEESSQPRRRAAEGWRGTAGRCLSSLSQGLP